MEEQQNEHEELPHGLFFKFFVDMLEIFNQENLAKIDLNSKEGH
jgi:hypothetical protein